MLSCIYDKYPCAFNTPRSPVAERKQNRTGGFGTHATLYFTGSRIIIVYHRVSSQADTPLRLHDFTCVDVHHDLQFHYFSLSSIVKKEDERRRGKKREKEKKRIFSASLERQDYLDILIRKSIIATFSIHYETINSETKLHRKEHAVSH